MKGGRSYTVFGTEKRKTVKRREMRNLKSTLMDQVHSCTSPGETRGIPIRARDRSLWKGGEREDTK